ncbi:Lrp/AsnC family transcriptional regulator [Chloroflexota bacterium]
MDQLDQQLILLLRQDVFQTQKSLAKKLGVSNITVRRRMERLIKLGILRTQVLVDHTQLGYQVSALICFHVVPKNLDHALHLLSIDENVTWTTTTAGRFDIVALARFRSTSDLDEFIRKKLNAIEGVSQLETLLCLQMKYGRYLQP